MSKTLSIYIAALDYFGKALNLNFAFPLTKEIIKKLLITRQNKKKKHNIIIILARDKLNSTETLITQELIDSIISHEECTTIINEEEK